MEVDDQIIFQMAGDIATVKASTTNMEAHLKTLNGQVATNTKNITTQVNYCAGRSGRQDGEKNSYRFIAKIVGYTTAILCSLIGGGVGIERIMELL